MRRPLIAALVLCFAFSTTGTAQEKGGKKKLAEDSVKGYKIHTINGFTVVVSDEVLKADVDKYKRKPVEAIELELKNVTDLMTAKAVTTLRNIPVWAEWDERITLGNGRQGRAYATYYGGNQLQALARGMNPEKAKCVVIHLTKSLTEEYQDKTKPDSLLLLHEFAHAVHDQLLSFDNADIKSGFKLAMSRKLYDKSLYCATNEMEFFAEMTCAYLDRLGYFPNTREDLKKHDAVTFKLMESIWGKAAADGGKARTAVRPPNGADEFRMDFKLPEVKFGRLIDGPKFDPDAAVGKVTAFFYWYDTQASDMKRIKKWADELSPYGYQTVILNANYREEEAEVDERVRKAKLPFTVLGTTFMPRKTGEQLRAEPGGHVAVYADDKWVYRGKIAGGETYIRELLAQKILKDAGVPDDAPKALRPIVTALQAGESFPAVITKLQPATTNSDAAVSEPAKKLMAALAKPVQQRLEFAESKKKSDPVEAFLTAESVVAEYKGTPFAAKADRLVSSLKVEKAVAVELKARKELDGIKKIEAVLNAQGGSFDPTDIKFQMKYEPQIKQMKALYEQMKKAHPNAKATEEAGQIVKEFAG
ncbi:hypothetical protein [Limnoglobus roseus]|uniref:TlpA family protein disulfide reductase n=1 Tax=Limnoglobus roseus TaxID=2598579 RepID=A0A5C1ADB7_9BACT|nr:hypothetical protein [Limnoglobus roseus]QEL17291.1 TlpA family protein disulfide reductase [Limnoglobus roseus]